jgi:hypothetical protein
VHVGNIPADAVLEAVVTSAYNAQITAVFGTTSFAVGDTICVDQSIAGATILIPVQNGSDAAQVLPPPPDGGTCVPDYAFTLLLDDGGRPLSCNDGTQASLPLTTAQAVAALRAPDCQSSLASVDQGWTQSECPTPGGCEVAGTPLSGACVVVLVLMKLRSTLRAA